jgi:hypothetical protein
MFSFFSIIFNMKNDFLKQDFRPWPIVAANPEGALFCGVLIKTDQMILKNG